MEKRTKILIILLMLIIGICVFIGLKVFAATNIDAADRYAWNDVIGWIDFYITDNVQISDYNLTGYASSSVGYIAFDCATSPSPPADCAADFPDWKVANSAGILSGWAWNDQIGWISFNCSNTSNCIDYNYKVIISGNEFSGWAWNDVAGWISFNCSNTDTCGTVNYKVKTTGIGPINADLTSSAFDTGVAAGVVYNTLMYQGSQPGGTLVKFQFAASDSSGGPWNFSGYDGTNITYYTPTGPNMPVAVNAAYYNNKRYFRYRIFLSSDLSRTLTPQVDDVIITWSR